jgi:hypothetical protein
MSFEFQDAEPIKVQGTGRKAEPNPFTEVIAAIALKTKVVDGKVVPVAKAFTLTHEGTEEARKTAIARTKRQLSDAGAANDPAVTVPSTPAPVKVGPKGKEKDSATETVVTFWTVKRQTRPRKTVTDGAPATASTEQSAEVASA